MQSGGPDTPDPIPASGLGLIEGLCAACLDRVGVDGGGVSVLSLDGAAVAVHSTDDASALIEDLQYTLGEGPCVDAVSAGLPVMVPDLTDEEAASARRWPVFTTEARKIGVEAVFAFPIRVGAVNLGSMDLYRSTPGPLTGTQLSAGMGAAEEVGRALVGMDSLEDPQPSYPMTVHQASGMVMVQLGTTIAVAILRLRASAYAEGRALTDLAADVLDGSRRFTREQE